MLVSGLVQSACAGGQRPEPRTPITALGQFSTTGARPAPPRFWTAFGDPALDALIDQALVAIVWITHASVVDARATMLRGLAADAGAAVRARMMESEHEAPAARVRDAFEATAAQHVRYLALIEDGRIVAAAGTPSASDQVATVSR